MTVMAKAKITTAIDEDILKKIKIRAIEEDLNVGELIEKAFLSYMQTVEISSWNNMSEIEKLENTFKKVGNAQAKFIAELIANELSKKKEVK